MHPFKGTKWTRNFLIVSKGVIEKSRSMGRYQESKISTMKHSTINTHCWDLLLGFVDSRG